VVLTSTHEAADFGDLARLVRLSDRRAAGSAGPRHRPL
jgi:hypothetical protein